MTVWWDQTLCWWEAPLNTALTYKIEVLPNRLYVVSEGSYIFLLATTNFLVTVYEMRVREDAYTVYSVVIPCLTEH